MAFQSAGPRRDVLAILKECFASDSVELRVRAAREAGKHKSDAVASLLKEQLARDPSNFVRASLVKSLAASGGRAYMPTIVSELYDEDERVRANAVEAIVEMGDPRAVPQLIRHIEDPNERIRENVRRALQSMDPGILSKAVLFMLKHERADFRTSALRLVERTYDLRVYMSTRAEIRVRPSVPALEGLNDAVALRLIQYMLNDKDQGVRRSALDVVGKMAAAGVAGAEEALIRARQSTNILSPQEARAQVAEAARLAARKKPEKPKTWDRLFHGDPDVRLARLHAILKENDKSYLPLMRQCYEQERDLLIIRYLLEGFGKLGGPEELEIIVKHLSDKNLSLRLAAIHAAGEMGTQKAFDALKTLLSDENARVRGSAASTLCEKGALVMEDYLRDLVEKGDRDSLLVALRIIRRHRKPSRFHDLIKEIYDASEDDKVRSYAQEVESSLRRDGQITQRKVTQAFKWPFDLSDDKSQSDPRKIAVGIAILLLLLLAWYFLG